MPERGLAYPGGRVSPVQVTPLMLAAALADLDMVELLVSHKAKIEATDRYRRTALTHAIKETSKIFKIGFCLFIIFKS